MNNVIDIVPIITRNKNNAWREQIRLKIQNAPTDAERLYWQEIFLALLFEDYYELHGCYHPNDPILLAGEEAYLND